MTSSHLPFGHSFLFYPPSNSREKSPFYALTSRREGGGDLFHSLSTTAQSRPTMAAGDPLLPPGNGLLEEGKGRDSFSRQASSSEAGARSQRGENSSLLSPRGPSLPALPPPPPAARDAPARSSLSRSAFRPGPCPPSSSFQRRPAKRTAGGGREIGGRPKGERPQRRKMLATS